MYPPTSPPKHSPLTHSRTHPPTAAALREIAKAFVVGVVFAGAWFSVSRAEHARVDKVNRDYRIKIEARRKAFEEWLATQPYDDEVA